MPSKRRAGEKSSCLDSGIGCLHCCNMRNNASIICRVPPCLIAFLCISEILGQLRQAMGVRQMDGSLKNTFSIIQSSEDQQQEVHRRLQEYNRPFFKDERDFSFHIERDGQIVAGIVAGSTYQTLEVDFPFGASASAGRTRQPAPAYGRGPRPRRGYPPRAPQHVQLPGAGVLSQRGLHGALPYRQLPRAAQPVLSSGRT